jgi:dihydrofolate synthase/folylpolyglutamate synthase
MQGISKTLIFPERGHWFLRLMVRVFSVSQSLALPSDCGYNHATMNTALTYQDALDYIYSFVDYSLTHMQNLKPENFDLGRMAAFASALGDPHNQYKSIHVAGSKGKGSVTALCAAALQAAGYQTGMNISPHLIDFTERILINGQYISQAEVISLVEQVKPDVAGIPRLTTFEIITGMAFLHFAQRAAEVAVVEVGMGGRLDATNILTPQVSAITSLSLEHTYVLGSTLAEIAGEKGGIIKPGVPVVVAPQEEEARRVLERLAAERNAPCIQVGRDYQYELLAHSIDGQTLRIWAAGEAPENGTLLQLGLLGAHQAENAAVAYAALQTANHNGLPISTAAIQSGFAQAQWQGRLQILNRDPLLVVDGAHNVEAVQVLHRALEDYFSDKPVVLVVGFSEDKDIKGMLRELLPRVESLIATQAMHPRAMAPEKILAQAESLGVPITLAPRMEEALETALRRVPPGGMILVCGSLFAVGAAIAVWQAANRSQQ